MAERNRKAWTAGGKKVIAGPVFFPLRASRAPLDPVDLRVPAVSAEADSVKL